MRQRGRSAGGHRERPRRRAGALFLTGAGDLLLTVGGLLLAFVAYQLWWTGVTAAHARADSLAELQHDWAEGPDTISGSGAGTSSGGTSADGLPLRTGHPFAEIRIPRLGAHWRQPVVEGVAADQLAEGVGHYPGTALPGQVGNVALAGHRATHGEPFRDLDRMRTGDTVVLETRTTVYTYVVTGPWHLVHPTDVQVIAPVPGHPGQRPTQRRLTLTTCHPRWASTWRLVVDAVLRSAAPRRGG